MKRLTLHTFMLSIFLVHSGAAAAAPITLTYWEEEQPHIQADLDAAVALFEKAHKDVKIRRAHYKTEDLRTQYQVAAMGRSGPDLILTPNDFAGVFSIMGLIQPVESWAKMDRFAKAATAAITDDGGKSWGVPLNHGNHLILFVNRKLIAEAPITIEDLITKGKVVRSQAKDKYGLAFHALEPFWFVPFMAAFGEYPLVNKKPNLDNEGTAKALALIKQFKFDDKIMPEDCDYSCVETLFLDGKAAMTINGDWAITKYHDALGKDLIIAPLPASEATKKFMEPMASGKYFLFNAKLSPAKLAAAKTFVEFMVSKETQKYLAEKSLRLPSLATMIDSDVVTKHPLLSASRRAMAHSQPMPMAVQMRVVWDAIRPQLQEIMAGRGDPKAAAKIMQKDAESKIREMSN